MRNTGTNKTVNSKLDRKLFRILELRHVFYDCSWQNPRSV